MRWNQALFISVASLLSTRQALGQAQPQGANPFECATCLGTQTIPYWGPVVLLLFAGMVYLLFFHQKPFPTLDDDKLSGDEMSPSGTNAQGSGAEWTRPT